MYLQLPRSLAQGTRLFATVQVKDGLTIAVRGKVVRVESRPHGLCGAGVQFARSRVLAA